jgi:hypothetical protein
VKVIEEIMGLVRRYAPTLIAHLLLLLWLSVFVIDVARLPDTGSLWKQVSIDADSVLVALGLKIERWTIAAALLLAYLTLFEWVRGVVLVTPVLRVTYRPMYAPSLLGWACQVFRIAPEPSEVSRELDRHFDRMIERARQSGSRAPYQHLEDQRGFLLSWYGTVLILLAGLLTWIVYGAPYARSPDLAWRTVGLLALAALGLRWSIRRNYSAWRNGVAGWALDQYERERPAAEEDPLRWERRREMERRQSQQRAYRRSPVRVLSWIADRAPRSWSGRLLSRLNYPRLAGEEEWLLVASPGVRWGEVLRPPPVALSPDAFVKTFESLLERRGAGLAVIAPHDACLAPGAEGAGSVYSFTKRRHGYGDFGVTLEAWDGLDQAGILRLDSRSPGFIVRVGDFPVQRLAARQMPQDRDMDWWNLLRDEAKPEPWISPQSHDPITVGGITLAREAPLEFGASYLLGVRTEFGTTARAALRACRIENSQRLLIAWCVFEVSVPREAASVALPWWDIRAWKTVLRPDRDQPE